MSYVEGTLSKDEEIKEVVKLHWINYVITVFLILFAILIVCAYISAPNKEGMGIWVCLFVWWPVYDFLRLYTTEMVVTNKRVICRKGIIGVKTEELKYQKIESVEIKQSILGRIFGYGTLWFSGTGSSKVKFENIEDPWTIKSRVETIIGN